MKRTTYLMVLFVMLLMGVTSVVMGQNKPFLVVLDAGHGGHDAGAVGRPTTNREKDINLAIALKVGKLLQQNCPDVQVLYTRSTDVFVTLSGRADIANKAKADLFVSIHTNAIERSASRRPMGVQSYTLTLRTAQTNLEVEKRENSVIQFEADGAQKYSFMNPNSPESEIMFELMQDHDMKESVAFAKMAQDEMVHTGGRKDMGVRQANLAVLRLTYMPSVLLEVGFISTPAEEQFLMSKAGQNLMAKSIYNAIAKYAAQQTGKAAKLEKPSATPVQPAVTDTPNDNTTPSAPTTTKGEKRTVYKVQVLAGCVKLKSNDKQFKGLKCEMHEKNGRYTYTYGSATTMDEAKKLRQSILDKFPQAFIVTFEE